MSFIRPVLLASIALASLTRASFAQLRPLDPIDYNGFTGGAVRVSAGAAYYNDQRASLAGTQGELWELGNVRITIRTGRVIMDMGGTIQRLFDEDAIWAAPYGDAAPPSANRKRHDAGDYRVGTIIRLTPDQSRTIATLRFGTRLPTTDNRVGLDRDATDFFTTLGAHRSFANIALSTEAGLSINGTRKTTYEQSDVFVYAATMQLELRALTPYVTALGQEDFHDSAVRGNEDLGEVRVGFKMGTRAWIDAAWVHGYREFSPGDGLQLSVGAALGR